MINEKITVQYYIRKDNRKIFFDYKKVEGPGKKAWLVDTIKVVDEAFKDKMSDLFLEYDYVEEGDFDDSKTPGWVTIKVKTSHSNWYDNDDVFNAPSTYYYQVPIEVEKEARELQAIRKKHQGDDTFSFWKCDYYKRQVRVADHSNY